MAISLITNRLTSCIKINTINLKITNTIAMRNKIKICNLKAYQLAWKTFNNLQFNTQMDRVSKQILNLSKIIPC